MIIEAPKIKRQRDELLEALKEVMFRATFLPEDEYAETKALDLIATCIDENKESSNYP